MDGILAAGGLLVVVFAILMVVIIARFIPVGLWITAFASATCSA